MKHLTLGIIVTLLVSAACASTTPTSPSGAPSSTAAITTQTEDSPWPVKLPNGGEDPRFPPPSCACPAGFEVAYNGANFICRKPGGAAYEVVLPDLAVKSCK